MQVNSIPMYNLSQPRIMKSYKAAEEPTAPVPQTQEPEQAKSVYFGHRRDDSGRSLRNATMGVLIPLTMLTGASGALTSCDKDAYAEATAIAIANDTANVEANAEATANLKDSLGGDGCHHGDDGNGKDTVYITKYDTCYIDTGSYHHDIDTVTLWKDRFDKPIPLDTLTKHMFIFDVDGADTINNKNIVHYEYTREWEYNNRAIANINILESAMNKNVLVHDVDVRDYRGEHLYYGKEVRRMPSTPVTLENKDGSRVRTDKGIFLELRKNNDDNKNASLFDTELENRYFLQTAGDSVKVYEYVSGNRYVEKGKVAKGYLGDNSILLKNCIGDYPTDDHLVDVVIKSVDDNMLKEMYARARDNETNEAQLNRTAAWRRF